MLEKLVAYIDELKRKREILNSDGRGFEVNRLNLIIKSLEEIVEGK